MSLSSLLQLEDLLRLILLLPQSVKIQDFTKRQVSLRKFRISECLLGLVTAEDLNLVTTADLILQFINEIPGFVGLTENRDSRDLILFTGRATPLKRLNMISNSIKRQDEETQRKILKSLDTSSYTKKELVDLVRTGIEVVEKSYISGPGLMIFKDEIKLEVSRPFEAIFFPQHLSKLE